MARKRRVDGCGTCVIIVLLIIIGIAIYGMTLEGGYGKINTVIPEYRDMYNQLNDTEKEIYASMRQFVDKNELSTTFSAAENPDAYVEAAEKAVAAFCYDFPEFFWLTGNYTATAGELGVSLSLECYSRWEDPVALQAARKELSASAEHLARKATRYSDEYRRVKYIHDQLVLECNFDYDALNKNEKVEAVDRTAVTAYDCLVKESALAEGYAKGFQMLMSLLEVEGGYATGSAGGEHAWNYVAMDGEYYWVDVTKDNPVLTGYSDAIYYDYLCITDEELEETHEPDDLFEYPECDGTKYNYFLVEELFFEEYDQDAVAKQIRAHEDEQVINLQFGYEKELETAVEDLFEEGQFEKITGKKDVKYELNEDLYILRILNK